MSREIDTYFYGENSNNPLSYSNIYDRIEDLYYGIGKSIIDIYCDEVVSLLPNYEATTKEFIRESIERFLLFGELAINNGRILNDTELNRTIDNQKYKVVNNMNQKLDFFIVRKDILFQEGINSERLGLSLLTECAREIKRYNLIIDSTTIAIKSKSVDIIKGEVNPFTNATKELKNRIVEINRIKGFFSTIFLKDSEDFLTSDKNLSNIDKAIEKVELALCSVSKIPYYRLFGKVSSSQRYSGIEEKKAFQKALTPLINTTNKILEYYCNFNKIKFEPIKIPTLDIEYEQVVKTSLENLKLIEEVYNMSDEEKKRFLKSRGII